MVQQSSSGIVDALKNIEYVLRKDSLTDNERVESARIGVTRLLAALSDGVAQAGWQCHAKLRPEVSDCMWPDCGCDPYATKVIESLLEQGWTGPVVPSTDREGA